MHTRFILSQVQIPRLNPEVLEGDLLDIKHPMPALGEAAHDLLGSLEVLAIPRKMGETDDIEWHLITLRSPPHRPFR